MKITIEFEHPCELVDLLRKLSDVLINDEPVNGFDSSFKSLTPAQMAEALRPAINSKSPQPTMYTEQDETQISHDHAPEAKEFKRSTSHPIIEINKK